MSHIIYYCLYFFILSINFLLIFYNVSYIDIKKKFIVGFILINTALDLIIFESKNEYLLLIISSILLIYFSFTSSKKLLYSIFIVIFTDIIFAVSDAIVGFIASMFFNVDFKTIPKDSLEYFQIALVITLISFIISKILNKLLSNTSIYSYEIKKNSFTNIYLIFYTGIILIAIYLNIFQYKYLNNTLNKFFIINVISTLSCFAIVLSLIYLNNKNIINKLQKEYKDKEFRQLTEYMNTIETMSDDLRRFKHDYINIMEVIDSYIRYSDMDGLKSFYKNELQPENNKIINKNRSLYLLKNIEINSLKGLISSKIHISNSNDVNTYIEITDKIDKLDIDEIDICRIIGILFDNAIEAAVLCTKKIIRIVIVKKQNYISFIICNTCSKNIPPIYKIYENKFSTKGEGRGIGLNTIRKIIDKKYSNVFLNTKVKNCIFTQELVIKNLS
ncbi:sensor histidine kinase [Clostridium algifaecis]|uniref:sensor histidine kinase n=1 Tax=Clostridium algifaecis TaxID=1472040 RepID=UPI001AE9F72F|nr:GHKL domain-containing protein [Clostridium algifaecis]